MRSLAILLVLLAIPTPWERAAELANAGDFPGAEREYRAILQAEPDNPVAQYNLGAVLLRQGRYDEARELLELAARHEQPPAGTAYNLGNTDLEPAYADSSLAERDQRLRRAIEAYKQALLADADDQDAKWNLELARRLLERDPPPAGGGGGGGGGGQGPPSQGEQQPEPTPGGGSGPQPRMSETEAESLLRSAQEREMDVQRDRLMKPQPPGPIRP